MASLPPQRPQARQGSSSASESHADASSQQRRTESQSPSARSLDSQTLFLNNTSTSTDGTRTSSQEGSEQQRTAQTEDEGRKCWICFQDEIDDGPNASPWRSPCPCALTAHEQCLLDWIADMEAPGPSRSTAAPKTIKCPQCKSEIHLSRPKSLIVKAASNVEKAAGRLVVPGALTGLAYCLYIVCSHHGAYTIRMIFGPDDARRILSPTQNLSFIEQYLNLYGPSLARPWFSQWRGLRLEVGLPLIPAALIASRTNFADAVLPVLPIVFFATHPEAPSELANGVWPPSAALTLVMLPYLRGIYDEYMERVWGDRERAWMKEIRPRLGHEDSDASDAGDDEQRADNDERDDIVELEVDIQIADDDDDDEDAEEQNGEAAEGPPPIGRAGEAPRLNDPPQDQQPDRRDREGAHRAAEQRVAEQVEQVVRQEAANARRGNRPRNNNNRADRYNVDWVVSTSRMAELMMGALAFPSVCAAVGEGLRAVLPASWTVPLKGSTGRDVPTGLLQTRWGRSIIGGCLFVVLKDALRIYCRWKMAQAFRHRRVQDYDKKKGRVVDPA